MLALAFGAHFYHEGRVYVWHAKEHAIRACTRCLHNRLRRHYLGRLRGGKASFTIFNRVYRGIVARSHVLSDLHHGGIIDHCALYTVSTVCIMVQADDTISHSIKRSPTTRQNMASQSARGNSWTSPCSQAQASPVGVNEALPTQTRNNGPIKGAVRRGLC